MLLAMNIYANIQEITRLLHNMIRTGLVVEVDTKTGRYRVQSGCLCTDWLPWLTQRAGHSRSWWAPSIGEQVLPLSVGGERDTAFVPPGIYSNDNPEPLASADGWQDTKEPKKPQQQLTIAKITHKLDKGGHTSSIELNVNIQRADYELLEE